MPSRCPGSCAFIVRRRDLSGKTIRLRLSGGPTQAFSESKRAANRSGVSPISLARRTKQDGGQYVDALSEMSSYLDTRVCGPIPSRDNDVVVPVLPVRKRVADHGK